MAFTRDYSAMFEKIQENQIKAKEQQNKETKPKRSFKIDGEFKIKYNTEGKATIDLRFLPSIATEAMPYVESWEHFFENGPTAKQKFWSVKCRKILGLDVDCPICKENRRIYKHFEGEKEKGKKEAQSYTHSIKKNYYSNVYIVQNDNDPETEGRVYILKYGKQIFDMINELSEATSDKENGLMPAVNAFDVSRSATFHWVISKDKSGRPSFDGSKFYRRENMITPLCDKNDRLLTESELEDVEKALYALEPLVPKNEEIPSYENVVKWHYTQCGTQLGWYSDDEIHEDEVVKVGENKFELLSKTIGQTQVNEFASNTQNVRTQQPISQTKKDIDEMVTSTYSSTQTFAGVIGGDEDDEDIVTETPKNEPVTPKSQSQSDFWAKFNKMK